MPVHDSVSFRDSNCLRMVTIKTCRGGPGGGGSMAQWIAFSLPTQWPRVWFSAWSFHFSRWYCHKIYWQPALLNATVDSAKGLNELIKPIQYWQVASKYCKKLLISSRTNLTWDTARSRTKSFLPQSHLEFVLYNCRNPKLRNLPD